MASPAAAFTVVHPSGHRTEIPIAPLPFTIGRQPGCHLVLRDSRVSRSHARVAAGEGGLWIEDTASSHGIFVNGERIQRKRLRSGDRVEFGVADSYALVFHRQGDDISRAVRSLPAGGSENLGKLRALLEVSRAVQGSLSMDEVLAAVVDAALEITGRDYGYLYLKNGAQLELRIARGDGAAPPVWNDSIPGLHVPLVHIRPGETDKTCVLEPGSNAVGMLCLASAELTGVVSPENRELLQTLAIEASAILENARLLEQDRSRRRLEEELDIARGIQRGLQPRDLPRSGWFQAAGASTPSLQVGGDYYDVRRIGAAGWSAIIADVSGKGVSSALLASFLQGAFLVASAEHLASEAFASRLSQLLFERTGGEKYATLFYCTLSETGLLRWTNAGHCSPLLVRGGEILCELSATGMPAGLLGDGQFGCSSTELRPGDKLLVFTDGVVDARNPAREQFGMKRLRQAVREACASTGPDLLRHVLEATETFADGVEFGDDLTAMVLEFRP
jgi:serine phosphatase RsbU (regulator of sigma subunit)